MRGRFSARSKRSCWTSNSGWIDWRITLAALAFAALPEKEFAVKAAELAVKYGAKGEGNPAAHPLLFDFIVGGIRASF